eukprot:COSAG02_NODE_4879_length_4870_cov_1.554391_4_plen_222_part_00
MTCRSENGSNRTGRMTAVCVLQQQLTIESQTAAIDSEWQAEAGITHVLCCARELKKAHLPGGHKGQPPASSARVQRMCVSLLDIMDDQTATINMFRKGVRFIEQAIKSGGHVLVHCKRGRNRSSSLVCAYMMQREAWSVDETIEFVKRAHHNACASVFAVHGAAYRATLELQQTQVREPELEAGSEPELEPYASESKPGNDGARAILSRLVAQQDSTPLVV